MVSKLGACFLYGVALLVMLTIAPICLPVAITYALIARRWCMRTYYMTRVQVFVTILQLGTVSGFQIAEHMRKQSGSRYAIGYGTLYKLLGDLVRDHLVERSNREGRIRYTVCKIEKGGNIE